MQFLQCSYFFFRAPEVKQKLENDSWDKKLKILNVKDNSIWKMAEAFTEQTNNTTSTLHGTQRLAFSNKQKANVLAENFEKVHHLTENMCNSKLSRLVNTKYKEILHEEINCDNIAQ